MIHTNVTTPARTTSPNQRALRFNEPLPFWHTPSNQSRSPSPMARSDRHLPQRMSAAMAVRDSGALALLSPNGGRSQPWRAFRLGQATRLLPSAVSHPAW